MLLALSALALADPPNVDAPRPGAGKARADAAVVIGVEDYAGIPDAPGAEADARAMEQFLRVTRGVQRIEVVIGGTRNDMRAAVVKAADAVRGRGMLWIYFSGQGGVSELGRRVLLGRDATPFGQEGLSVDEIANMAANSRARSALLILDASFGGAGRGGEPIGGRGREVPPLNQPSDDAVSIWSASTGMEVAGAYPSVGHGMFSYLVLGALRGWADGHLGGTGNDEVTYEEAQAWVARHVRLLGGKGWAPSQEVRPQALRWSLARGPGEDAPPKEALAAMAQAEKQRRVTEAQNVLLADATAKWMEIAITTTSPSAANELTLRQFIERYDMATVTVDGVDIAMVVPQVQEARTRLDSFSRSAKKSGKRKKKSKTKVVAPAPPPGKCDDLVRLEPAAITGMLTSEEVTCLEGRVSTEKKQTAKDKVSRVLLANADGKQDVTEWMRLASRHLEEIDRSDPDLCFRYALFLSREGDVDDGEEVLRWVGYALENKQQWEGPAYVSRVYNLYRLQAEMVGRMWMEVESDFQEDRSEEKGAAAEALRGEAKNAAREWLDWARATEQPAERAFNLCQSAAGSMTFCEPGAAR